MDIAQRREIVSRFLRRCVTYADASIERKKSRNEDPLDISNWENYRQFTSFSASEVESGELDTWLEEGDYRACLLYTSPSPRDLSTSRMPSSA